MNEKTELRKSINIRAKTQFIYYILFRECKNCGSDEILKVARAAKKGAKAVRDMTFSHHEYEDIRVKSLEETKKILDRLREISNATLSYVEKYSYNGFFERKSFYSQKFSYPFFSSHSMCFIIT